MQNMRARIGVCMSKGVLLLKCMHAEAGVGVDAGAHVRVCRDIFGHVVGHMHTAYPAGAQAHLGSKLPHSYHNHQRRYALMLLMPDSSTSGSKNSSTKKW